MVIDDKGGEIVYKDRLQRNKGRGSINFEHKNRGSKLMNLYGAIECALYIFACMVQVLNFNIHACVVYASYRFEC